MPEVRPRRRTTTALAALAVLAVLGSLVACSPQEAADPTVADQGYEAGDGSYAAWPSEKRVDPVELDGTTFDGEALDLADLRGDVVVLNFWYAECPPCRAEAPDLAAISTEYAEDGVRLVGVNGTDSAPTVAAFSETFGIDYPSIDDASAVAVAAMEGLVPLTARPTTVILDREGRPAAQIVGLAHGTTLRQLIDDVLAETS